MNYKVVIEGEVFLTDLIDGGEDMSDQVDGDPNCFISGAMPLTITDDGVYTAPQGRGYSPVTASVVSSIPWAKGGSF